MPSPNPNAHGVRRANSASLSMTRASTCSGSTGVPSSPIRSAFLRVLVTSGSTAGYSYLFEHLVYATCVVSDFVQPLPKVFSPCYASCHPCEVVELNLCIGGDNGKILPIIANVYKSNFDLSIAKGVGPKSSEVTVLSVTTQGLLAVKCCHEYAAVHVRDECCYKKCTNNTHVYTITA